MIQAIDQYGNVIAQAQNPQALQQVPPIQQQQPAAAHSDQKQEIVKEKEVKSETHVQTHKTGDDKKAQHNNIGNLQPGYGTMHG